MGTGINMNGRCEKRAPGGRESPETNRLGGYFAGAGLLGAIAASSCCVLPFVFFSLGIGGAWLSGLTALGKYNSIFVIFALGFLAAGFWSVYRSPRKACAGDVNCTGSRASRLAVKGTLWTASVVMAKVLAWPFILPLLLAD